MINLDNRVLYLAMGGLGAVLLIIVFMLWQQYRKESASDLTRMYLRETKRRQKRNARDRRLLKFYNVMCRIPFAGSYIKMAERVYLELCPYDNLYLTRLVAKSTVATLGVSLLFACGVILLSLLSSKRITVVCVGCAVFAVYVCGKEVLKSKYMRAERTTLADMNRYLAAVGTKYAVCKSIPEAILEGADGLNYEMRRHALRLYEILDSSERADKIKKYVYSRRTNKFLKMLAIQAYEASERGDIKEDGKSLFAKNLESLRMELMREQLSKERRNFVLQGYAFATLLPLFCMELLRVFGEGFSEGMASFYSSNGKIVVLFAFLTTIVAYDLVNKARDVNMQWLRTDSSFVRKLAKKSSVKKVLKRVEEKPQRFFSYIKKMLATCGDNTSTGVFLLKMMISGTVMFGIILIFVCMVHSQKREGILLQTSSVERISVSTSAVQQEAILNTIREMIDEYKEADMLTLEEIKGEFRRRLNIRNEAVLNDAAMEIERQIRAYRNEYLHWYEFWGCVAIGLLSLFVPVFSLWYRYGLVLEGKDDEVRQFQAIILMERLFPDVTVLGLLEEMESFAVVFRPSLRECINNYSLSRKDALLKLKAAESDHIWFTQLIDGFLASDDVGIATAFANLDNNREMFERNKEFESEVLLAKKKDRTDIVALLPAIVILGGYFIIPFVMDALGGVVDIYSAIEQMQGGL